MKVRIKRNIRLSEVQEHEILPLRRPLETI